MKKKTIFWIVVSVLIIWIIFCNMDSGMRGGASTKVGCSGRAGNINFAYEQIKFFCSPFVKCIMIQPTE